MTAQHTHSSEPKSDPRHVGRSIALQELFTQLFPEAEAFSEVELLEILEEEKYDEQLTQQIVSGVTEHEQEIDRLIAEKAPAWPIEQIAPIDLLILRMGIWEGRISQVTPPKIVINECIELAKEFGGSSTFINGVLANLLITKKIDERITI